MNSRSIVFESVAKADTLFAGAQDRKVANGLAAENGVQALGDPVSRIKKNGDFAYQITRIDSESLDVVTTSEEQSQRIVISLTDTIKNVSEQLEAKEQRIATLENRVLQLEKYIEESGAQARETNPIWPWMLISFLTFSLLVLYLYRRFWPSGRNGLRKVEVDEQYVHDRQDISTESTQERISKERGIEQSSSTTGDATRLGVPDEEPTDIDEVWKFGSNELSEDVDDLSFNEHFERLLGEKDFEFARELLDFARYTEINDERYHCERLHLFEKMNDEDGFYEYYYQIESKIPTFPRNLQTQISKFVVQLAQR